MIYCIGDSFTFGAELPDAMDNTTPSNFSWPALLSQKLNKPVINLGKQGSGPTRIVKRAMDCVFQDNADIIVVAWPSPDRIEWCDKNGIYDVWAGRNAAWMSEDRHKIIGRATADWVPEETDRWNYRRWLRTVILLQTFFKSNGQKYIMLQTYLSRKYNMLYMNNEYESKLIDHIDKDYFLGWPEESMMEWTYGTPTGPWGHFLEQGHKIVAEKVYEYFRHLGWIS